MLLWITLHADTFNYAQDSYKNLSSESNQAYLEQPLAETRAIGNPHCSLDLKTTMHFIHMIN